MECSDAGGGTRTRMGLLPGDFKSPASTDFATPAVCFPTTTYAVFGKLRFGDGVSLWGEFSYVRAHSADLPELRLVRNHTEHSLVIRTLVGQL